MGVLLCLGACGSDEAVSGPAFSVAQDSAAPATVKWTDDVAESVADAAAVDSSAGLVDSAKEPVGTDATADTGPAADATMDTGPSTPAPDVTTSVDAGAVADTTATDADIAAADVASPDTAAPSPCKTNLDCPGSQLCDKAKAICVDCLLDADCGKDQACWQAACVAAVPCASDLACVPLGQLCNKALGLCVGCLVDGDCAKDKHCAALGPKGAGVCAADVCVQGSSHCQGKAIASCNTNGSGYKAPVLCGQGKVCVESGAAGAHCADGG